MSEAFFCERRQFHIGGQWVDPSSTEVISVISPTTEKIIGSVPNGNALDIDRAVEAARLTFEQGAWSRASGHERAAVLERFAAAIERRANDLITAVVASSGLPIQGLRARSIAFLKVHIAYFAGLIREQSEETLRRGAVSLPVEARVRRTPAGVVGVIIPWNIPLLGAVTKLTTAWAAGCTTILKPAPYTPFDAFLLAELAQEAGLPPGVFNVVSGGIEASRRLVEHPDVDLINFTGSTATGRLIAESCARRLRRCTLELGGNAPAIVLDDAPIDTLVPGLIRTGLAINNGQACIAQRRIIVPRKRLEEITDALSEAANKLVIGSPFDDSTVIGPLVSREHRDRVLGLINVGRSEGARLVAGGGIPAGHETGWYVAPTIFSNVDNRMRVAREETFGPVLTIIPVDGEEEAIATANDTEYGLSGSVWSADADHALAVARRIRAGSMWINGAFLLDPALPFGGWKDSGIGRDLGIEGLHENMNVQSIFRPA